MSQRLGRAARLIAVGVILAGAVLVVVNPAQAADIVLDGAFADWLGQPVAPDPAGDAASTRTDLQALYFTHDAGGSTAYFMAERWQGSPLPLLLVLYVDTGNDGSYAGPNDRLVTVIYLPFPRGRATVDLYSGEGAYLKNIATSAAWGEAGSDGRRVEWEVSFADLGIAPFQAIRVQLVSLHGGALSDSVAEVQWSPANALGYPLLAGLTAAGAAWLAYRRRRLT
ncbi:MAG: hypothetical protein IT318_21630 [Anaerolineales bacterium]|nr:hypothetical protein [Anaerolineales bacterium]